MSNHPKKPSPQSETHFIVGKVHGSVDRYDEVKGKGRVRVEFKTGSKVPARLFSEEEIRSFLASGVLLKSPRAKAPEPEPPVNATTGADAALAADDLGLVGELKDVPDPS